MTFLDSKRSSKMIAGSRGRNITLGLAFLAAGTYLFHHFYFHTTINAEYVAMGSSFAAGPGDGHRVPGSLSLCEQSDVNYPHLLARQHNLSLNDVTCSGATTKDILDGGQWFQPAQVNAVNAGTKLVTVTIGGNDVSYLGSLTAWACANQASQVPWLVSVLGFCRVPDEGKIEKAFQALPDQLREIVAQIHSRAPEAQVLFIDYTTVLPDTGTCARLPLTSTEADRGRNLANRLREETATVARETNSGLILASEMSHGHDACSNDPWVYGFQFPSHFFAFEPVPFHPSEKAMQEIANALGQQVSPFLSAERAHREMDWSGSDFVQRQGTHLTLAGKPYRFGGVNIEWLGLEDYGPKGNVSPHVPTDFEVEDALSTAEEMGSRVIRAQTMGDTVGCPSCLEPSLGVFNDDEFRHMDSVIASAARHHIRLIVTLTGDCTVCIQDGLPVNTGMNQYLKWLGDREQSQFYGDPRIVTAFEKHIGAILEHRNTITGIAYKDDPTILAWENCNLCSIESHIDKDGHFKSEIDASELRTAVAWVAEIGRYIKSIDSKHLYLDNSGFYRGAPEVLDIRSVDVVGYEYYPHWALVTHLWVNRKLFNTDAALIGQHRKVDVPVEIGWDRTNWFFESSLRKLVSDIERNQAIAGDGFWALAAHAPDHGWQPIPVDDRSWKAMLFGESGEWWALYYTGRETRINGHTDMALRAQILRDHFYAMAGIAAPPHHPSTPPAITLAEHGTVWWRGSPGSTGYDIERSDTSSGPWRRVCARCIDDSAGTWADPDSKVGWYRMIAYNLDGVPSSPSEPREMH